ncbi:hypothetical protein PENSPDRAFT_153195 [Peniophora sp. CONT]|nr:hypothetical protein PENSPDRAFT_153195 [Peniophora sp. CONT]
MQPALGLSIFDSNTDSSVIVLFTERPGALNPTWTGIFREGFTEQYNIRFKGIVGGPPHFMHLLSRASSAVNPHTITTLELSSVFHYEPPSWSAALAPFGEVHTLYIESMFRPAMLLSLIAPEQNASPETPLILPKLRFLWLSVLDLRVMNDHLAALDRFSFSRIFSSRIQQGTRIDHLRINKLVIDKMLAENVVLPRLRALVPVVECESIIGE